MSQTLNINITSLNPDRFEKDTSSTATNATVDQSGNINLQQVDDPVVIAWTLADSTGETFESIGSTTGPVKFRTTGNPPSNPSSGIFSAASLSNGNKTVTVTDTNGSGAAENSFNYTLYEANGPDDPSIRNRN
jgi:hypothetical protein